MLLPLYCEYGKHIFFWSLKVSFHYITRNYSSVFIANLDGNTHLYCRHINYLFVSLVGNEDDLFTYMNIIH